MTTHFRNSILAMLLLLPLCLWGQKPGFVTGTVKDMFSEQGLEGVLVELYRQDTILVDSVRTRYAQTPMKINDHITIDTDDHKQGADFRLAVPDEGNYLLRLSLAGYEPLERSVEVRFSRRNRYHDVGELWLGKARQHLGEAVVRTTKVKMFFNGDTLVYNADAFQVEEGSMLEDLVKRLPGVELRNGQIYAHGRFVESITLGGKDFFKGNPQEALKNLPAYVVDKLQFYNKEGELSKTMGEDVGDKVYVMDVKLKREYIGTWSVRPSIGFGTHGRYAHNLQAMRFDDRQSFVVSGDMNNVNTETEALATMGKMTWSHVGSRLTHKAAKLAYTYEPNDCLKFASHALYKRTFDERDNEQTNERYLTPINQFLLHRTKEQLLSQTIEAQVSLALRPTKGQRYEIGYALRYNDCDDQRQRVSATLMGDPYLRIGTQPLDSLQARPRHWAAMADLRNLRTENHLYGGHSLLHSLTASASWGKAPHLLNLKMGFDHTTSWFETFEHKDLHYFVPSQPAKRDFRNVYALDDKREMKLYAKADYFWKYLRGVAADGQLQPYVEAERRYAGLEAPYHRLDSLPTWGAGTLEELGTLPSQVDWRARTFDFENGLTRTDHLNQLRVGVNWEHRLQLGNGSWVKAKANLPLALHDHRLYYHCYGKFHQPRRTAEFFNPKIDLYWYPVKDDPNGERSELALSYQTTGELPNLRQTLEVVDEVDPLYVNIGNAKLRNLRNHELNLDYRYIWRSGTSFFANASWQRVDNAVGVRDSYEPSTGVRTSRFENVSGNERQMVNVALQVPFNEEKTFGLEMRMGYDHLHSADLNYVAGMQQSQQRIVHNHIWSPQLSLRYEGETTWGILDVRADHRVVDSRDSDFTRLAMTDWTARLYLHHELPWRLVLSSHTDLTAFSGVSDAELRRARLLWSVSLSKEIVKRLWMKLAWEDVFNANVRRTVSVDAQGRTTHFNRFNLPSHVLLTLSYRINYSPKKK